MVSIFRQGRDSEGREFVEIGMNGLLFKGAVLALPLVFAFLAWYLMGRGPRGLPWFVFAAPLAFAVVGYSMMSWMGRQSKVRVTVDPGRGVFLVDTSRGRSEIAMADVAAAEFASSAMAGGASALRLEFVLKNGSRVPATSLASRVYGPGDRVAFLAPLESALRQRMA